MNLARVVKAKGVLARRVLKETGTVARDVLTPGCYPGFRASWTFLSTLLESVRRRGLHEAVVLTGMGPAHHVGSKQYS